MGFRRGIYYKIVRSNGGDAFNTRWTKIDDDLNMVGRGRDVFLPNYRPGYTYDARTIHEQRLEIVPENPKLCTVDVLHASPTVMDAVRYGRLYVMRHFGGEMPSPYVRLLTVYGQPVVVDKSRSKYGFLTFDVIEELKGPEIRELLMTQRFHAVLPNAGFTSTRWSRIPPFRYGTTGPLSKEQADAIWRHYFVKRAVRSRKMHFSDRYALTLGEMGVQSP